VTQWKRISVPEIADDYEGHFRAVRLNSLGSLYYFTKYTLAKDRLRTLHEHLCRSLEAEDLHLVMEVPMGFFKTISAMALSIWWALPMQWTDEKHMRDLGYKAAWIRYMRNVHNQNTRTLIAHEIDKRAVDIGKEVDFAYFSNDTFRHAFPEIIPDKSCEWNDHSKHQKRTPEMPIDPTNPTFAYCGVGHALQGVHPDSTIEDDVYGKAAQQSVLKGDGRVSEDTIRWHTQLTTRLDTSKTGKNKLGRQLVLGNRWGHRDLNAYIREKQPHFIFETHDAESGCCKIHPKHGASIFPEEWPWERLKQREKDLGRYDYYHFMRNLTTLPEECIFNKEWLHYFKFAQSRPDLPLEDMRNILLIHHEPSNGEVIDDCQPGGFVFRLILDANHEKKQRRTEHVIIVVAYDTESTRIYLMDMWSKNSSYTDLVDQLYKTADRWHLEEFWMGEAAAELLNFYLNQRNRIEKRKLIRNIFPDDDSLAGMKNRIGALEPIIRRRQIWAHRNQEAFIAELGGYPGGAINILDALSHFSDTVDVVGGKEIDEFMRHQREAFESRGSGAGGY
jgi:hypothetical protein